MMAPDVNVVTLIDPDQEMVELRPQEILHVVYVDGDDVRWHEEKLNTINLKPLRYEVFITDGFDRPHRGNFEVLAQTRELGVRQYHWWFRVNPADARLVMDTTIESQNLTCLKFHDNNNKNIGSVLVKLVVEKEDKQDYCDLIESSVVKDEIYCEAQYVGIMGRVVDSEKGYILNPGSTETAVFEQDQREMLIEIAEPTLLSKKTRWRAVGFNASWKGDSNFSLTELADRIINGTTMQRWLVKNNLHALAPGHEQMRLGTVTLRVDTGAMPARYPQHEKKINFWLVRYREVGQEFSEDDEYGYCSDIEDVCSVFFPKKQTERTKPRRMLVEIKEIGNDLMDGVKTKKTYWRKKQVEVCDPQNDICVTMPKDQELVVHLYKDHGHFGAWGTASEWQCHMEYHSNLELSCIVGDHHRQKFIFTRKEDGVENRVETLKFRCHERIRRIHVKM